MYQLIIGVDIDKDNLEDCFFKIIKGEETIRADEWLENGDIAKRFNMKFNLLIRKFENIDNKNEKIQKFNEIITCVNGHIYVYFKGKDY